jgi:uncharacterized protein (TIGR02246 family)
MQTTATDVKSLFDDVCAAWNAADAVGLAAHYAPTGRLINPFGHVTDGREAIAAGFIGLFRGVLAGTSTTIEINSVRELAPGLVVVDGTQTLTGPIPPPHVNAVVGQQDGTAEILECRPYAFLPAP